MKSIYIIENKELTQIVRGTHRRKPRIPRFCPLEALTQNIMHHVQCNIASRLRIEYSLHLNRNCQVYLYLLGSMTVPCDI